MVTAPTDKDLIAQRAYATETGDKIVVKIWRPVKSPANNGDYLCHYQILGIGHDVVHHNIGADSLQALLFAITWIKNRLQGYGGDRLFYDGTSQLRGVDIAVDFET